MNLMKLPSSPRGIAPFTKSNSKWDLFSLKSPEERYNEQYKTSDDDQEKHQEQNKMIQQLKDELQRKNEEIENLQQELQDMIDSTNSTTFVVQRKHQFTNETHLISDEGAERVPIATRGSVLTSNVLRALPEREPSQLTRIAEKFVATIKRPLQNLVYLKSKEFANDLIELCYSVCDLLEGEPRCHFLQSPVYVIGDIHGNLEDLHFFSDNLWQLGMELAAGKYLFLGDYVDRGMNCLECVAYLFALKVLCPSKIYLLRGNHETRSVNGWEEHYKTKSFLYQCKDRFGPELGESVWEEVNQCFDRLPVSAVIDHDIFCIHGGIPRTPSNTESSLEAIMQLPTLLGVNPSYEHETSEMIQIASDCLWSDPANEEQEDRLDHNGFGRSLRGGDCVCFGMKAINDFLLKNQLSFIIRAHEAHAHGVSLSKSAKVFTVFSTSRDHGQGIGAIAGCILVDIDKLHVINRSPAYKNKYIHHRSSIGCDISEEQLQEISRLGLLRTESHERR